MGRLANSVQNYNRELCFKGFVIQVLNHNASRKQSQGRPLRRVFSCATSMLLCYRLVTISLIR